jgi:DNA end-binding protein Ku
MARAIWKGSISFGLVTIPVGLFSAENRDEISFRQLDKKNLAPVGYKKYNKQTGKEVELEDIVKGYEYEEDRYVLISDEDLQRASPEKTQTVDITDFVDLGDIQPIYFDKPYYLGPTNKKNMKAYALLREALKRSGKVGIARVVIRTREYLAAVVPQDRVLVLEILRYPYEIRSYEDLDLPGEDLDEIGVGDKELAMAQMLIDTMTGDWEPEKYHDTYRDDLMALIHKKIESGQTEVLDETPAPEAPTPRADVIDIMSLLKKSVEATGSRPRLAAETERKPKSGAKATSKAASKPASKAAAKPSPKAAKPAAKGAKPKPKAAKPRARKTA